MTQRSFAGGELAPSFYSAPDLQKYQSGLRTCRNMIVRKRGLFNRPGTELIEEVKDSAADYAPRLIKFVYNADQTYILEFGDQYIRFFRDMAPLAVIVPDTWDAATNYVAGDTVRYNDLNYTATTANINKQPDLEPVIWNGPRTYQQDERVVVWDGVTTTYAPGDVVEDGGIYYYAINNTGLGADAPSIDTANWHELTGDTYEIPSPYVGADLDLLQYVQSADVLTITHPDYAPRELSRVGDLIWLMATITFAPGISAPIGLGTSGGTASAVTWGYVVTAVDAATNEESVASAEVTRVNFSGAVTVSWSAVTGAGSYNIYRRSVTAGGSHGFVGTTTTTSYPDDTTVSADLTIRPPVARDPFSGAGNYPRTVSYYQERQLFAGSDNAPETVNASQTGSYHNFTTSTPLQDDDAVTFTLSGRKVNQVRHLLDLDKLIAFASGGIYVIEGDEAGILRPGEVNARLISSTGVADHLAPLVVDNVVMFMQARGSIVRSLNDKQGADMTLYAQHLFQGFEFVDWDYAETPDSILYLVRTDGVLLGLTYIPEQDVWGWHRHDTDGTFERVLSVPEGTADGVYVVAKRTIDGVQKRYIERFAARDFGDIEDAIFMDSALSYNGWNTTATHYMSITGGTTWEADNLLTITSSVAAYFTAGDVGNAIFFHDADGEVLRIEITTYTSDTVVKGYPSRDVPVELQIAQTADWAKAVDVVTSLDHLEGKAVSVLGDGYVVASPNNAEYDTVTVTAGSITLDQPYAEIRIGLPYLSDMETLDYAKGLVNKVSLWVEATRGVFAGREAPSDDAVDPLEGLYEYPGRDLTGDADALPALITDEIEILVESNWDKHGRVFVRQVDPLPLAILSVTPEGYLSRRR